MAPDNPLRGLREEPFASWLRDLSDVEAIELLEAVSADMKRRNELLRQAVPGSGKSVKEALDAFLYGPGGPPGK